MTTSRPFRRIFAIPVALGLLQAVGLTSALVGDGPFDLVSWATLGVTVLVAARFTFRRSAARP